MNRIANALGAARAAEFESHDRDDRDRCEDTRCQSWPSGRFAMHRRSVQRARARARAER